MKAARQSQTLEKINVPYLYRSSESGIFYGIFRRKGDQTKKSLKTTDKKLSRCRLEGLRQKVARLNTKAGKAIVFADLAKRRLDTVSGMLNPSSRVSRHRRCGPERQRREHEAELTEILQHRPQADRISELGSLFTHKSRRSPFPRTTYLSCNFSSSNWKIRSVSTFS